MPDLSDLSAGKGAVARALAAIETAGGLRRHAAFLDACVAAKRAQTIGLTGPPGVGKSTLTNALIRACRAAGLTVAVVAVDPSSRRTGGALLGDRTRLKTDPEDGGIFVRSLAARDRLGGLSDHAVAAVALLAAAYDRVIVESVGIGQSEADVAMVADTLVLCIQPGSGDSLQFMKAGVMEIPDIVAVTKADMGAVARRAVADVEGALSLGLRPDSGWIVPVLGVSSTTGEGLDTLIAAIACHSASGRDASGHHRAWIADALREAHGREGLRRVDAAGLLAEAGGPFRAIDLGLDRLARPD